VKNPTKTKFWGGVIAAVLVQLPAGMAMAQSVPGTMAFSARLVDAGGPVEGSVDVQFRLFDAPAAGAAIWMESHVGTAVTGGVVHATLGSKTENGLDAMLFDGRTLYLEVEVDGDTLSPRVALMTVPYAFRAASAGHAETATTADTLDGLTAGDLSYEAGAGLSKLDNTFSVDFGGTGSSELAARSDHTHPPPGLSLSCLTRTSDLVSVSAGAYNFASTACITGEMLTGGGCWTSNTGTIATLIRSYPTATDWLCGYTNSSAGTAFNIRAYAQCCRILPN
jgi:hypothetical protein